ncbi:Small-conductance mechanosensitive channel [Chitinophaga costaii]|uniref:Small-conductance mechanosensitive channel n=1 Tax=Chitinophaga costaii TaxID=1335309 RepID=A0A1C4FZD2_9BACT|nr:mechanosensitive ion channel domain-containing protein [Chitinophaga costaii]PUZ20957.1 mechanosensitive ion channel protein MscS [Chitinophaga costaii]SCC61339.1 Small-conductance mechanosensitive channel [Chitinophaga costaii]
MWDHLYDTLNRLPNFLWNLLLIASAFLAGLLIKFILTGILHLTAPKKDGFTLLRSILRYLGKPVNFLLPVLVLNLMQPYLRLNRQHESVFDKTVDILLTTAFAALLIGLVKVFEDYVSHVYDLKKSDNLRERKIRTQLIFIRKFLISVIVVLAVCTILLSFDHLRKLGTGLLTGVGVGGIIIGFAAQKSLGNLLAGFQIAFTQPIRIDDVLVVEGEWGRVEEITLTYVVLSIWDQRSLILPINYFIEKPFQNWTHNSADILGTAFLYLDYSIPIQPLRKEFTRLLQENPLWDKRVNAIQVTNTNEHTIELRALMSAANASNAFDLRCYIREKLIDFVQQNYPESLPKTRAEVKASGFQNAGEIRPS